MPTYPEDYLDSLLPETPFGYRGQQGSAQADQFAVMRDDRVFYFGSEGDVEESFDTAKNVKKVDPKGAGVLIEGLQCGHRKVLTHQFGGKLVQLNASIAYTTDQDFEILGTNASNDDVTNDPEGGLLLETDTAANDQVIVLPHLDANQTPWTTTTWGTDQEVRWEASIKTKASIADVTIWLGLKLTNTSVTATDNDQAFFRYQNGVNGGKWQALYSIANADTALDTGVTATADTDYRFVIRIDSSRVARFYINNVLVGTSAALTNAVDLIPYVGIQAGTTAAKSITLRYEAISRNYA